MNFNFDFTKVIIFCFLSKKAALLPIFVKQTMCVKYDFE